MFTPTDFRDLLSRIGSRVKHQINQEKTGLPCDSGLCYVAMKSDMGARCCPQCLSKFPLFLPMGRDELLAKTLSFLCCRWQPDVLKKTTNHFTQTASGLHSLHGVRLDAADPIKVFLHAVQFSKVV